MAKVLNPLNSSEARGRVGGLVYNTWRGIRTVKTHTAPGHQSDPKRQAHKLLVQNAGQRWRTLSDAQRAAWDHFADHHPDIDWTGRPVRLAGFHWYVRINTRRYGYFGVYRDAPPQLPCLLGSIKPWLSIESGDLELYWTDIPGSPGSNHYVEIWLTRPLSAGRNATIHDAYYQALDWEGDRWHTFGEPTPGTYTAFTRPISLHCMIGVFESCRLTVPPP